MATGTIYSRELIESEPISINMNELLMINYIAEYKKKQYNPASDV